MRTCHVASVMSFSLWSYGLWPVRLLCPWQEYWSRLSCPSPGCLPEPEIKSASLMSLELTGGIFTTNATWELKYWILKLLLLLLNEGIKITSCFFRFSSVTQSGPTLWDPMDCSTPGLTVYHHLLEFTQTHVHWVSDAIQPSHPLSSPSPPTFNLSQHQGLFKWVSSSHQVARVLEFQLQHQSF